jgi:hypothetical protein
MEFGIPILSQEAYSGTQRESTLEKFEELRLKVIRCRKQTIATISVGEPRQRYFLQRYFLQSDVESDVESVCVGCLFFKDTEPSPLQ